ncbi:thioredoxin [Myxococcota bacterium]|nr:thioredoxin [Myxococcota bacterium]
MAVNVTDSNFRDEVLNSKTPVLVDFWAPWCAPCRMVGPTIEKLGKKYQGKVKVVKLDVQDNPRTAALFGIRSIPTVSLFAHGKSVGSLIGARSESDYDRLVTKAF